MNSSKRIESDPHTIFGAVPPAVAAVVAATGVGGCASSQLRMPIEVETPPPAPPAPPEARRTLAGGVPVTLAPISATPQERYQHYANIVEALDGDWRAGEPYVVFLRGILANDGTAVETTTSRLMADAVIVLDAKDKNAPRAHLHVGSTYPGQLTTSRKGVDANRDGKKDVGMVREGNFRATPNGLYNGGPSYHIKRLNGAGSLPGVRDTNQDGRHSDQEWKQSAARGDKLSEVLIHPGAYDRVSSIGCFNVRDYSKFVSDVGGSGESFGVSVVNGFEAEPI